MDRRSFLQASAAAAFSAAVPYAACAQQKPNIVFIVADDLGWKDLACFDSPFYETPNIDRLRRSGLKFTQAYTSCPVCSPTRASLMTGKYPTRTGVTDYINSAGRNQPDQWQRNTPLLPAPYSDRLAHNEVTLAEAFQQAGYATFFAGKWHLGPEEYWPTDQGFDINKGGTVQGGPWGGYFSPYENPNLEDGPEGEHLPDRLARETASFINHNQDRPFFAYLSFYSVHTPLQARKDLIKKYKAKAETMDYPDKKWGKEGDNKIRLVQDHAVYAGMVEAMDQAVGVVLDTLEETGLDDHTIVMFCSDNGGLSTSEGHPTANVPLRAGKGWMYEGGIRQPMLVRVPGITQAGSICREPVISTDFYPTLLELCNLPLKPKQHVDGKSFVPLLRGEAMERGPLYWHYPHYGNQGGAPSGAVREGDWKLIEWYEDGRLELFNLKKDIGETNNLAGTHPEKTQRLHKKLIQWREATGAKMPTTNPDYKPDE